MRYVSFIDSTTLRNFKETIEILKESGVLVLTSGTNDDVFKELKKENIVALIGEENMYKTYPRAVLQAKKALIQN